MEPIPTDDVELVFTGPVGVERASGSMMNPAIDLDGELQLRIGKVDPPPSIADLDPVLLRGLG